MKDLTVEEVDALGSMQLNSLEVHKTPTTPFDVAIKSYVDGKFSQATALATQAITDLIDGSPAQLDTLKEIATALNNDANLASVLTSSINNVQTAVTSEASARASADASLEAKVSAESSTRSSADVALHLRVDNAEASLVQEQSFRASAVSEEAKTRSDADASLETKVSNEASARSSADAVLDAKVSNEASARSSADAVLDGKISDEKTRAESAEYSLSTQLQEESQMRNNDVQALMVSKFDASPFYSGGSESHFKVSADAYLYIGNNWRIRANTGNSAKRLEFQYSADGSDESFRTAIPFIRA
jgi:hypothetical protein